MSVEWPAQLTDSFDQLGQYASSSGNWAYCCA